MKITIDLQDPETRRQLQLAIDENITALASERVQAAIEGVIKTKLERLTDKRLDELVATALATGVKAKLEARPSWNQASVFEAVLKQEMSRIIRENLTK